MKSKTYFVAGLLLSLTLGLSIRVFLSPAQLRYLVETQVSRYNPKAQIRFDQVELVLSEGLLPRFGVRFVGLALKAYDPCRSGNEFFLSDLYAPLDIPSVIAGQPRIGKVRIQQIQAELRPPTCEDDILVPLEESFTPPDPKNEDVEENVKKTVTTVVKKKELAEFKRFFRTRFDKELANTKKWLGGVWIGKVLINDEFNQQKFSLENTELEFDRSENSLIVESDLGYIIGDVKRNLPVQVMAEITATKIDAKFDGNYREGDFELDLAFNIPELEMKLAGEIKYVPFIQVMDAFDSAYLQEVKNADSLRLMWVSCLVKAEGQLLPLDDFELNMSTCKLSGDSALVEFSPIKLYPLGDKPAAPFIGTIKNLDLEKLASPLFSASLRRTLINPGSFKGRVVYDSPENIQVDGKIEKMDVLFSRGGKRRIQRIKEVSFQLALIEDRISGQIKDIGLLDGNVDGQMSFNLGEALKDGVVQSSFKTIELASPIENLLFEGDLEGLAFFGRGQLRNGQLDSWQGQIGFSKLSSKSFEGKEFKADLKLKNSVLKSKVAIGELKLNPSSGGHSFLTPLFLFNNVSEQELKLDKVKFQVENHIDSEEPKTIWRKFSSRVIKPKAVVTSEGRLDQSLATGWVSVDMPNFKLANWEVYGSSRKPLLSPTQDLLTRLAEVKRSTERTQAEDPARRVALLNKILRKDNISRLTELGKAMIDKAKALTGDEEEPEEKSTK